MVQILNDELVPVTGCMEAKAIVDESGEMAGSRLSTPAVVLAVR